MKRTERLKKLVARRDQANTIVIRFRSMDPEPGEKVTPWPPSPDTKPAPRPGAKA